MTSTNGPAAEPLRLALAGGGSGGHIYPALAVAQEALSRADRPARVTFVVTREGLERKVVEAHGHPLVEIPAARLTARDALKVMPRMWAGIRAAIEFYRGFRPHAVYGTGGFVSFPAVVAAWWCKIPALIHEPNTVPGRANRLLAFIAQGVVTHYRETASRFGSGVRILELGTPLRYAFDPALRRGEPTTVLVLGGSQGAQRLNRVVKALYPRLAAAGLRVIHVTGTRDHAEVAAGVEHRPGSLEIVPYTERMDELLYRADLAISRSGALTVCELVEFGIPAIYVPFPHAVGNHQFENVRPLGEAGASRVLEEAHLDEERLWTLLTEMTRPDALARHRENLAPFRRPGATRRVLEALEELVGEARATDGKYGRGGS